MAKQTKKASAGTTAEVNDNKALLEAKDATIAELKEEVVKKDAAIENAVKEQVAKKDSEITELKEQLAGKDEELAKKDEAIATLTEQLEEAKGTPTGNDKPSYKGYQFLVDAFKFKGNKHTAEDAVKNPALMKELIDAKFSSLKKVK
ncbi:hypothetical protein [Tenacibaculum singaporense]|uniref:hypothetical protein n=1 Tax=Tenacibaculum singaporense TaxID=2358479 RepID=UPI000F67F4FA|nr:hypothetical protein [Tenacibaculum singaporense]RSC96049.1 hypothetical protein EI424_02710 [Tenacibaculum singaporense]